LSRIRQRLHCCCAGAAAAWQPEGQGEGELAEAQEYIISGRHDIINSFHLF
jgi:hypothetical protein